MRFASVIFSTLLYLLPSVLQADTPPKNADPADKILVRLSEMKTSDQQAWLQGLENRAIHAAKLSMNADEAAVEQKKIQGMLHQKMVTWKILREVMAHANAHEKTAIDRLVRRYRYTIESKESPLQNALFLCNSVPCFTQNSLLNEYYLTKSLIKRFFIYYQDIGG